MSGFFERTTRTFEQLLSPFRTTRMKNQQQNRTSLENCILLELWETVLERFHKTSMKLQSADLDLNEAVALLESLMNYTTTLRDSFEDFEEKGRSRSRSKSYKTEVGAKTHWKCKTDFK
jgi:hypothetical protein